MAIKIGFAGTDARTLVSAATVSQTGQARDVMGWDIDFIPTKDNSAESDALAMEDAFASGELDYAVPMPICHFVKAEK